MVISATCKNAGYLTKAPIHAQACSNISSFIALASMLSWRIQSHRSTIHGGSEYPPCWTLPDTCSEAYLKAAFDALVGHSWVYFINAIKMLNVANVRTFVTYPGCVYTIIRACGVLKA